jgi:ABC-type nickel/cobalt efflux system permease component RcnA
MTPRSRNIAILVVLGFAAFLLWSTLSSQRVECSVAVEYQSRHGQATASGASEPDALREALTAACGPIAGSMNDRIACGRLPPVSRHCRTL